MIVYEDSIALAGILVILLLATYTDIRAHRISNLLTFGGVLLGLVLSAMSFGSEGFLSALGGAATGFCLLLPFYILRVMAAGDVKLMTAVGAFLGPWLAVKAVAFTLITGMVIGLGIILFRGGASAWLSRYLSIATVMLVTGKLSYVPPASDEVALTRFPYASAIMIGTLIAIFGSQWI